MEAAEGYPEWEDYEWYAVDPCGHIAAFTTAGEGPVPTSLLSRRRATESFRDAVGQLPLRGGVSMLVSLPRPDDFIFLASRGFFIYDWYDVHRTKASRCGKYEMLSEPENPMTVADIPAEFHGLLGFIVFQCGCFRHCPRIDVREYTHCEPSI